MNKKRINRLVSILNIISIVAFYIFAFSKSYLMSSIITDGENGGRSIFNSFIIDILLRNIQIILPLMYCGIGAINIICAIQNKQNKKIFFWQLVFGIYYLWTGAGIIMSLTYIDDDIIEWINRILFGIIPIILAIINLILIIKRKSKVIQIISYVAVVILSVLNLFGIIGTYWQIIAVVMQLIYIHFQDKNIEESKSRKIVNIVLYYGLQMILSVGFLLMVLSALLITKVNEVKWEKGLKELYNNITELQGSTTEELYIPVEKNYKFGFITDSGAEKISCEYDRVSYFNEVEINGNNYYISLAKKNNKFYIISKNNDSIEISGALEKYIKTIDENLDDSMTNMFNKKKEYRLAYLQAFEFYLQVFTRGEIELSQQTVEEGNDETEVEVSLTEKNSKFTYKNANYTMLIEPIRENVDEDDNYDNYYKYSNDISYDDEDTDYMDSNETKYKVTVKKNNGDVQSKIVYLPGIDEENSSLETFTNGFIEFKSEDEERVGWYDDNGNQVTIPGNYEIRDIKDNKIILRVDNNDEEEEEEYDEDEEYDGKQQYEMNFIIIDMTGKTLLQTSALDIYSNMYLVKNSNKKMVLMDKNLKVISNEYDKIITTVQMDISANYSSYY